MGKAQYNWPPYNYKFSSAAFDTANIIKLFLKQNNIFYVRLHMHYSLEWNYVYSL
jgi:hypothetical protein